ncbi:MAG: 30S ribosomal protein S15 [Rickettsiales bacterium]|jgi:small subunit ribosomal protein S15|nr:30S ribosomal protein S15 [Rickettsiales bacterium]
MSITKNKKTEVIKAFQNGVKDTGSSEVQIAILTERINNLTEHMKANKKDNSAGRGLSLLVNARKKLLAYLKNRNAEKYQDTIKKLNLRK